MNDTNEHSGGEPLQQQVEAIKWYHTIDFGGGVVSRGLDNTPDKLRRLKLPDSFAGKTVLDIGAWDGFFSFEAERRGAARVLATDSFIWGGGNPWYGKGGFELARRHFNSKVLDREIDILEMSAEKIDRWDIVFFLGVLYHMKHPLLALEHAADVTKELLVVETVVDMLNISRPAIAFYPGGELSQDPSNWCGPNPSALIGMLQTVGFKRFDVVMPPRPLAMRFVNALQLKMRKNFPFLPQLRTDRMVVHAWK